MKKLKVLLYRKQSFREILFGARAIDLLFPQQNLFTWMSFLLSDKTGGWIVFRRYSTVNRPIWRQFHLKSWSWCFVWSTINSLASSRKALLFWHNVNLFDVLDNKQHANHKLASLWKTSTVRFLITTILISLLLLSREVSLKSPLPLFIWDKTLIVRRKQMPIRAWVIPTLPGETMRKFWDPLIDLL